MIPASATSCANAASRCGDVSLSNRKTNRCFNIASGMAAPSRPMIPTTAPSRPPLRLRQFAASASRRSAPPRLDPALRRRAISALRDAQPVGACEYQLTFRHRSLKPHPRRRAPRRARGRGPHRQPPAPNVPLVDDVVRDARNCPHSGHRSASAGVDDVIALRTVRRHPRRSGRTNRTSSRTLRRATARSPRNNNPTSGPCAEVPIRPHILPERPRNPKGSEFAFEDGTAACADDPQMNRNAADLLFDTARGDAINGCRRHDPAPSSPPLSPRPAKVNTRRLRARGRSASSILPHTLVGLVVPVPHAGEHRLGPFRHGSHGRRRACVDDHVEGQDDLPRRVTPTPTRPPALAGATPPSPTRTSSSRTRAPRRSRSARSATAASLLRHGG